MESNVHFLSGLSFERVSRKSVNTENSVYNVWMKAMIASMLIASSAVGFSQSKLTVGDTAPTLKVAKWVKGSAVKPGTGKYTVVEFWATWCGPCKTTIPHLTDMAKKYKGKVDFVGVSVWESDPKDYTTKVPAFVKEMGKKMDYNVATDSSDMHMANKWMKAAGENGIPAAFLIDPKGKVAWIGHPMDGLDGVIKQALAGKYKLSDAIAARKKRDAESAKQEKMQAAMTAEMKDLLAAQEAKDWNKVLSECDRLDKKGPEFVGVVATMRYTAMLELNHEGLAKVIDGFQSYATDAQMVNLLNSLIWMGVENDRKLKQDALDAYVRLGEKMMALDPKDPMATDTFALALWRAGKKEDALKNQKKAVELGKKDSRVDEATRKDMESRLKMYGG